MSLAELARLHLKKSHVVGTCLTCDLRSVIDWNGLASISEPNSPGEKQLVGFRTTEQKDSCILQKEISLLRKEDGEAREVDDLIIHLCLAEIRIACELCGKRWRDAYLAADRDMCIEGSLLCRR